MSEALIAPTYGEVLELRRHFKLLHGSTLALDYLLATPAPTSAQLTTWLATDENLTAYQRLISSDLGACAVCASSTAMAAIAGSDTALEGLRDIDAGRTAMLNSKKAMTAVLAGYAISGKSSAVILLESRAARAALYDHESAWGMFVATVIGKAALSWATLKAAAHSTSGTTHVYPPGVGIATRAVLITQQGTSTAQSAAGANENTYIASAGQAVERYVRVKGLTHRISSGSGTSVINYIVME